MITEAFDRRAVRLWVALLLGIPVTLIAVPFAFVGLVTGLSVVGAPDKTLFLGMVSGSSLGTLGILGAWLRLATTEPALKQKPSRRNLVLAFLAAGIIASVILGIFFWAYPDTRILAAVFGVAAVLGAFLVWVSLPVRPNSTPHTDARVSSVPDQPPPARAGGRGR